ncbi:pentatricopeptide repeat-containing protein At2g13600-like isoform X1 [Punica granatum]|uniref:Pentatricopeptide repeat-containing protein At2g13600-like isoform X1 n=1 Tax=Punica granatum TaxID=22663 RepID=A0A6P8CE97_PUNGR|nr:pentatricopeptide repeat-containing protein At2g13600-like isoform X1 [Punica granatum]XP_031382313.1 pentatricopeptide repeat-containing protein At2g13600-like isoform X1 [Punica granatum]XP_031382314.1 pentatricopeptide repeat-containing protein At2g13600-like isoform X1 [Punica granatum]XP_031382315.1 pentatricopeptide repeat-containing protein At2g13600-like isoform X1 [Punica granatum]XP_031382316.1 pentatricopeptide repeat-containing protein At2g13600-like isoform X1 [Punica granatum]
MSERTHSQVAHVLDPITTFLNRCAQSKNSIAIKKLHCHLLRTGLLFSSVAFHAKLILSYALCHQSNDLKLSNFFKFIDPTNALPFNILISDFSKNGLCSNALKTFSFMHSNGVPLDSYDMCSTLTASTSSQSFGFGTQVHALVGKQGWSSSVFVGSALIDLYAKSSLVNEAAKMFDEMPVRNTVCANALLLGFTEAKMWNEVLGVARNMPELNMSYDNYTFSAILRSCIGLSAVELGRQVHCCIVRNIHYTENDVFLQSSLIEMYGKCGFVKKALLLFNALGNGRKSDLVLWTSMLGAFGRNGYYKEVIQMYEEMLMRGIIPDEIVFVTVLSACARTGQVERGIQYFESMTGEYGLTPCEEHYSCLIDLLSRAGELGKAQSLVDEMLLKGFVGGVSMWGALLNACLDRGNFELGKFAAQKALDLDPQNMGVYTMLSNLYAKFGMWDEIELLRASTKRRGLNKDIGCSWIEVTV